MANNFFCFQLLQLYSRRLGSFTKFTQSECAGMLMDLPTSSSSFCPRTGTGHSLKTESSRLAAGG
ncbi:uncharacterized protein LOC115562926 isoform X1 [Drosophila navojoa]|uniref:uncharacterized protein LOC115562926 isoform X1 n=1 Tax=Drosophila navojoa TaxID=7232 RepID=UPI0011BDEEED|nr:uncharacterized protein LOC115562926 isoform X1 [Drosophila navojoa]